MRPVRDRVKEWAGRLDPANPYHQRLTELTSWAGWTGQLGPDAHRYLVAHDVGAPRPFHYRWLVPYLCRGDRRRFTVVCYASLAAMVVAMRWHTGRWPPGLFVAGLPGIVGTARYCPTLVDAPAMALAILAAAACRRGQWGLSVVAALAAGATKETAPVFAALYAWSPLPLAGLAAPALRHLQPEGQDIFDPADRASRALHHPFEAAWAARQGRGCDPKLWLAPWGACLAGLAEPDPQTVLTVAAAYAQCAVATDNARLYQWAWPVLAENTTRVTGRWWLAALVAHLANPWKGRGE